MTKRKEKNLSHYDEMTYVISWPNLLFFFFGGELAAIAGMGRPHYGGTWVKQEAPAQGERDASRKLREVRRSTAKREALLLTGRGLCHSAAHTVVTWWTMLLG